jgi:hypothetical protein
MTRRSLDLDFDLDSFRVQDFTREQLVEMCQSRSISCSKRELKTKLGERLRNWHRQTYNVDGTSATSGNLTLGDWSDLVDADSAPIAFALPDSSWGLKGIRNDGRP